MNKILQNAKNLGYEITKVSMFEEDKEAYIQNA